MAGGKETPRQKMIGMMYLVLTALLALNVSSTVIDKFVFLNDSLVRANNETAERNIQTLESIKQTVDELGNREADAKVAEAATELRARAEQLVEEITLLKDTLVNLTGGYLEGHAAEYVGDAKNLVGKTNYDIVGHYMMPAEEGGEGHGARLKTMLNEYSAYVGELVGKFGADPGEVEHYKPIAVDADDDPVYSLDPNQKGKKFSTLAFDNSPTPAGLATLSEFQSRVLGYETRAIGYLAGKVGAGDLKFDRIEPMVRPESKYVTAGAKYSAEMFIAASSSGVTPTMAYNGNEIPVVDGMGQVEFTARASSYDKNGLSRQTYKADISVTMPGGRDTTFSKEVEYFVIQPVIQVQSTAVNALYYRCGNSLNVSVQGLGPTFVPSFSAQGAQAISGGGSQVTLVPTATDKVTLSVSNGGTYIGSKEFGVRPVPAPDIVFATPQGPVDQKTGMSSKTPRIQLGAVAEPNFAQTMPDDKNFRVAEATFTLISGGLARGAITTPGGVVNLSGVLANARKGDILNVEIKLVQRQNFRGQVEPFPIRNKFYNIPLQ
ncbi:MAG: gliding motility protein GldM [Bacteroidota bacterium]